MRAALLVISIALPAAAQDVPEASTARYACDGGVGLEVAYLNPPHGPSLAVVLYDGRLIPMRAGPTGSGVRYVAYDHSGLVWHSKANAGFLARDDGARQETLAGGCHTPG